MKQRLASVNLKTGTIKLDPALKGRYRRGVTTHMRTFLKRRLEGDSFTRAVKAANKAERGNMTKRQWQQYNGALGGVARWHSTKNRVIHRHRRRRRRH